MTGSPTKMEQTRQYCTFVVNGQLFGVEVAYVQEVMLPYEVTPVPLAPPSVRGLMNLRGLIVTAIDLRVRLALPPREDGVAPMNVVVKVDDAVASLLVDEIGDVLDVPVEAIERPPEALRGPGRALVNGVCKLQGRLMLALDIRQTVDVTTA